MDFIARQARDGDAAAMSKLLILVYQPVYAYLRRLCGNDMSAEDLMQDTFMKVWRFLPTFREESSILTWIHRIAYTTYIDWRRKHKTDITATTSWVNDIVDPSSDHFEQISERLDAQRLYRNVEFLDEHLKHVIHLHYYQELSLRDTAYVLNIATSTVKNRLRQAISFLQQAMNPIK